MIVDLFRKLKIKTGLQVVS